MNINANNHKAFAVFIIILLAISTGIAYALFLIFNEKISKLPGYTQIFIAIPSVPGIYVLLLTLFDRYFWKWKIFRATGIIVAEDLNGTWKGFLKSSHDNFLTPIPATLTITQTATKIKISGTFNQSKSISVHENFGKSEVDDKIALYYFFRNEPSYDATPTMAIHEGSAKLIYSSDRATLTGYYYSGRDRNNFGTMELSKATA